jgi:hypothetical protein
VTRAGESNREPRDQEFRDSAALVQAVNLLLERPSPQAGARTRLLG